MHHFGLVMQFLRDRQTFLVEVAKGVRIESKIISFLICSVTFLALYGAIIGLSHSWLQMVSSAIKLPALYLITLMICLPTLYIFEVVSGSSRSFGQYLALLLASTSVISVMMIAFAPVTLFFHLSINDYTFFKLLNVAIFVITGIVGINFFYRGMMLVSDAEFNRNSTEVMPVVDATADANSTPPLKPRGAGVIKAWLVLYGFVGSQLGWTLRPFFGTPDRPFSLFRELESNFYAHILYTITHLLLPN